MLKFLFSNETNVTVNKRIFADIVAEFENVLRVRIKRLLSCENGEVSLTLIGDKTIWKLNKNYRGKDTATDVLSFAYLEEKNSPANKVTEVGDIFISLDTAKKQAKEHSHSLNKELQILFTHGLLHLFGFDHQNDAEEKEMEKWAKKILEHIV